MRTRSESGFTVIELAITMALTAMVSLALFGILETHSNAEHQVSQFVSNQEDVRQAIVALQRDLRSSEPLTEVSDPTQLRWRIDLKMYPDVNSTIPFQVRWRVDASSRALLREIIDSNGVVTSTTHRLGGVTNMQDSVPIFTYYRADDTTYDLLSPDTSPGTVAYCTVRVGIDIRGNPEGGRMPARLLSDVQLRNKLPGADECPKG